MNKFIAAAARALPVCLATALSFTANGAFAGNLPTQGSVAGGTRQVLVRFGDLDLSKIEGVTSLYMRLRHAANYVCEPLGTQWPLTRYHACVDKAFGEAVATVNRPLLSQYYQLRTKRDRNGLEQLAKAQ